MRNPTPIIASLFLAGIAIALILINPKTPSPEITNPPPSPPDPPSLPTPPTLPEKTDPPPAITALSILAENPNWEELEAFQYTISSSDFERLLTQIFTTDNTWQSYITIHPTHATIITSSDPAVEPFTLHFATSEKSVPVPRTWKDTQSLPIPAPDQPLANLHIAIDPGHIGGEWANIEERSLQIGDDIPVKEGDMTLIVAKLLKPQLEQLGAKVTLVRSKLEPVTDLRPKDFNKLGKDIEDEFELRKFTERLFYRTAEIRARAQLVNQTIKPDLVLCLHFNADAWGNPLNPKLVPRTHFHVLLNGGYTSDEVHLGDQRFSMLKKLLQRTHEEEALISETVANVFAEMTDLPAFIYNPAAKNFRPVKNNPFLYARNLLANRLYDCPVIFMEPYVMNSAIDYPRLQAALKELPKTSSPDNIFQEYARALTKALITHYQKR